MWQSEARKNESREGEGLEDLVRVHIKFNNSFHIVTYHK